MAIVTYIVEVGVVYGLRNSFHPEMLGRKATTIVFFMVIQLFLSRLAVYIFGIGPEVVPLDVIATMGYSYVGLCATAFIGAVTDSKVVKYSVFAYVMAAMAFFTVCSNINTIFMLFRRGL